MVERVGSWQRHVYEERDELKEKVVIVEVSQSGPERRERHLSKGKRQPKVQGTRGLYATRTTGGADMDTPLTQIPRTGLAEYGSNAVSRTRICCVSCA